MCDGFEVLVGAGDFYVYRTVDATWTDRIEVVKLELIKELREKLKQSLVLIEKFPEPQRVPQK